MILLEETRERAVIRIATHKQMATRHHNSRVKERHFNLGDLVLRKAEVSKSTEQRKLAPNWEGPYKVVKII